MGATEPKHDPSAPREVRPVSWSRPREGAAPVTWGVPEGRDEVTPWALTQREKPAAEPARAAPPVEPPPPPVDVEPTPEPEPPPEPATASPIPEGMLLVSEQELLDREDAIVEALRTPYKQAASQLELAVAELETRLTDDVVELAARIAQALIYKELELNRSLVLEVAQRALRLVGPLERLTVRCAPEDAELLREHMPGLARVEVGRAVEVLVRPSDDIMPGGLLLTFEGGVVDAREERRLQRIVEAVKAAIREVRQAPPDAGAS